MTFRDDIDAAYARLDVLESENRKLVEENSKLRGVPAPRRPPIPTDHDAVIERIEALEHENRRLAENPGFATRDKPLPPPKPFPEDFPVIQQGVIVVIVVGAAILGLVALLAS